MAVSSRSCSARRRLAAAAADGCSGGGADGCGGGGGDGGGGGCDQAYAGPIAQCGTVSLPPHETDHRISRNHLLKRGCQLNGQKLSKFDTAAALISKWTGKSIERRLGAACHIVQQYKTKLLVSSKIIQRNE
jgi:hypothetical protein